HFRIATFVSKRYISRIQSDCQHFSEKSSVVVFKYLDILRRMFIPSCKAPERVDAVASASEGNEAGGKTDK
ncbi:MAG: hypothetical protein IKQ97_05770, partial [Eubacterium sp.]|nr:hypothetical protein [Eubacterium sp.]